jgi:hypothetical protein
MDTPKLTRKQAAIIGAYTGVVCGPSQDIHDYIRALPGFRGLGPAGLAVIPQERFKQAAETDFMSLCASD